MRMKQLFVFVVVCALGTMQRAVALCGEPQPRLVCAEYYASQVVLDATLLKVEDVHEKDDPDGVDGRFYTLKADRILRGTIPETFRVYEGNDSGRASFDWSVGTRYLLFLFTSSEEKAWSLEGCGNSAPVSQANAVLREIDRMNLNQRGGSIYGVVSGQTLSNPLSNIHLMIRGVTGSFEAATDHNGRFHVEVPSGEYKVEPEYPPIPLEPYVLTYENPQHVKIHAGGCAQLQFTEASKAH
jgi:hypothetical protein